MKIPLVIVLSFLSCNLLFSNNAFSSNIDNQKIVNTKDLICNNIFSGDDSLLTCILDINSLENGLSTVFGERFINRTKDTLLIRFDQDRFDLPIHQIEIDTTIIIIGYAWYNRTEENTIFLNSFNKSGKSEYKLYFHCYGGGGTFFEGYFKFHCYNGKLKYKDIWYMVEND